MTVRFKATRGLLQGIREDLKRPHPFAYERVGFVAAGVSLAAGESLVLAHSYRPVADEDYLHDPSVGAMMGPEAIRKALQWALAERVAIFHVHTHCGWGLPGFSGVDLREQSKFMPNFFQVAPQCPHGALVLSDDRAIGHIWLDANRAAEVITYFVEVAVPLTAWRAA